MNDHFTSHHLYYDGQYGFREKHSTQLAALELDRITHELDLGNTPIHICIHLSKEFYTIDHNIFNIKITTLWHKMSRTATPTQQLVE